MPLTSASETVPPGPSGDKSRDVDAESLAGASPAESVVSGSVRSKGKGVLIILINILIEHMSLIINCKLQLETRK